ncbi:MAG: radical SAM protein [Candidatus Parcubacteria bacterium]|nr:radical SAM protein [Candidatus Parcubacteria bacterium]
MLCNICPHNCNVDRITQFGVCQAPADFQIAHMQLHQWEEPCISGKNGSGTIFFSHCNLKCEYCQNYEISQNGLGKKVNTNEFYELCLKLRNQGAHNINLVTPTPYSELLIKLLPEIKKRLNLPIIWNSNGYEKIEILKQFNGLVDVYLPDFKYANNELALKYSRTANYAPTALTAIEEMVAQQPDIEIDEQGLIKKGVIIRHLVLPGQIEDSKKVLRIIKDNFQDKVWVSIMAQYCPAYQALQYPEINRILNLDEYREIKDYFLNLNFKGGFVQDIDSTSNKYTPIWQLDSLN